MRLVTRADGWFRFGRHGYGLSWKPVDAPRLFSERNGYTRAYVVGRWRVTFLKPFRRLL